MQQFDIGNWVTQLRKGLLELCVVLQLSKGEVYAYDLVKRLAGVKSLAITEGTVYPILSRLKSAGLLSSRLEESPSGPARKYYALTPEGRAAMELMRLYWGGLVVSIEQLMEGEEDDQNVDS
jgi:PadR family transcriptional regulator PadR